MELEGVEVERDCKVDVDIGGPGFWGPRGSGIGEWVKVRLDHRVAVGLLQCGRVAVHRPDIAQDCRVQPSIETSRTDAGISANPVIVDGLVGLQNERVALAGEDLDAVNSELLCADAVRLDDVLLEGLVSHLASYTIGNLP